MEDGVYFIFASLVEMRAPELRTRCVASAHLTCGYIAYKVFKDANELPWSLCLGDIAENVRSLSRIERPDELAAQQLWT